MIVDTKEEITEKNQGEESAGDDTSFNKKVVSYFYKNSQSVDLMIKLAEVEIDSLSAENEAMFR
jgi:hypothetical protein